MPSKKEETESQRLVEDDPQRFGYRLYRKAWEELLFQEFEQHLKLGEGSESKGESVDPALFLPSRSVEDDRGWSRGWRSLHVGSPSC